MFFGRNLHLIAPFELFPAGFCTEFQRASFVFSRPRADVWTPGQNLGPRGRHVGPGTFLDQFWGSEKHTFARKGFCGEDTGESPTPKWIVWSLGLIWVCYFVKNLGFSSSSSQFQVFPENRGTPQGRSLYIPYFPLWDALFPMNSRSTTVVAVTCSRSVSIGASAG